MARRNRVIASDDDGSQDEYDSTPDPAVKLRRIVPALDDMDEDEEEDDPDQEPEAILEEDEGEEGEEDDEEEEAPEEYDDEDESDDLGKSGTPQRFSIVIKRKARGGGALSKSSRGRGLPRGRPRGRPRGAGRGRGVLPHGMLVVQKPGSTPKLESHDDDDETYGEPSAAASGSQVNTNLPVGTTYRQIGGKTYVFEDDELVTEEDETGNTKIDINGNLLGGRAFKADTFCSPWRANPEKRYMLSIEAARTSGFRDSLYYFRRNPLVVKLTLSQAEKDHLISLGRLSNNLKSRSVTIVTARSAFKLHGSKMVKDGRWVTDDYYEEQARADCIEKGNTPGELVGELPDLNLYPIGDVNQPLRTLEERRAAAGGAASGAAAGAGQLALGAGGIYRSGGPTTHFGGPGLGPFDEAHALGSGLGPNSGVAGLRRAALAREGVSEDNWMWKTALRVHETNEAYAAMRKSRLRPVGLGDPLEGGIEEPLRAARNEDDIGEEAEARRQKWLSEGNPLGVYEPHTDMFHYRADTQPTHAHFEQLIGGNLITSDKRVGGDAWGVMVVETRLEPPSEQT